MTMIKRISFMLALVLLTGVIAVLADGDPNMANNPSFEGQYSPYIPPNGHPDCPSGICITAQMAPNWTPWWRSHNPNDPEYIIRMPEYKPADPIFNNPSRVRSGQAAQQYFTFFSTHEAGFYQQVSVEPGKNYIFRIWGHAWSAQDDDDAYSGPQDGDLNQKVGIDPTGGTDWQSSNIVWSAERMQYDTYGRFEVSASAQSPTMTVYVYSRPSYAVKHNDVYWDDAQLIPLDVPQIEDYVVYINWLGGPNTEWYATLDPSGTVTPILSSDNGMDGDPLIVTLDSNGFSTGTYTTMLTLTADPAVPESPVSIPVTLIVAEEISTNYIPMVMNK
jgi:hypothetical protein